MLRVIAFHLALLAAPFVAYAVYVYFTRRAVPPDGVFSGAPLVWLAVSGLALTITAFLVVAVLTGADPGGVYKPAVLRDGQIVPGQIVAPEAEPDG